MSVLHRNLQRAHLLARRNGDRRLTDREQQDLLAHDVARLRSPTFIDVGLAHIAHQRQTVEAQIADLDRQQHLVEAQVAQLQRDLNELADQRHDLTRQLTFLDEQRDQLLADAAAGRRP